MFKKILNKGQLVGERLFQIREGSTLAGTLGNLRRRITRWYEGTREVKEYTALVNMTTPYVKPTPEQLVM